MTPQTRGSATMHCFLSAPPGYRSRLAPLLERRGFKVSTALDATPGAATPLDALQDAISRADVVVGVLADAVSSASTYFELGYAAGVGKNVVLIVDPSVISVPFDLHGLKTIYAGADDLAQIDMGLDALLEKPPSSKKRRRGKSRPISNIADELAERARKGALTETATVALLREALTESGVERVTASGRNNRGVDLVVWDEDLVSLAAYPLLVEIKSGPRPDWRNVSSKVAASARAAGASVGLVVSPDVQPGVLDFDGVAVIIMPVDLLLERLRTRRLAAVVRGELRSAPRSVEQ